MRVDIEHIRNIQAEFAKINGLDLGKIEFYENDKPVEINPELLEEWKFMGMTNVHFILTDYYKAPVGFETVYE